MSNRPLVPTRSPISMPPALSAPAAARGAAIRAPVAALGAAPRAVIAVAARAGAPRRGTEEEEELPLRRSLGSCSHTASVWWPPQAM